MSQSRRQRFPFAPPLCMVLRVGWYIRTTRWRSSPKGNMLCVILLLARRGTAVPGAPLMMSALTTSFCGIGAISDGSFVEVGAGGVAPVERTRTVSEERRRAGLTRAPEQARRRDIGLVKTLALRKPQPIRQQDTLFWKIYLTVKRKLR